MAEPKRKPGRPPKHVGLATPAVLKQVADGSVLRDLPGTQPVAEGPLLPKAPEVTPPRDGSVRLFGAGTAGPIVPATLPPPGRTEVAEELTFTDLLKKVLRETAGEEFQEGANLQTNLEVLARKVVDSALQQNMGAQRARELIIERIEGKAQRAAQVQNADTTVEDQLDQAAVALLNGMTTPPDKAS